ncbi:hypothetical protein BJ138DRAFT_1088216 [Hygrophoropsis aurantiaca]|uniref:Uncharacterized protein n=1 Tax=Hygrophoropsis aurantiaca TaxID=72124 RepID=A0ACB8AAY5_9AGAM|nr:hypothetical protein BJ138DRAFT_1088216 [Hygrophoropsis aurantiaca]
MRCTLPLLLRIVQRSSIRADKVLPPPLTTKEEKTFKEPLLKILMSRQIEAGANWPQNLRIEPHVTKKAIGKAPAEVRTQLKRMLKER